MLSNHLIMDRSMIRHLIVIILLSAPKYLVDILGSWKGLTLVQNLFSLVKLVGTLQIHGYFGM